MTTYGYSVPITPEVVANVLALHGQVAADRVAASVQAAS